MKYTTLCNQIIMYCGGKDNITHVWNCFTRLRFNLQDETIVKVDEIKKLNGVLGTHFQNGQFQIIIGNEVGTVYKTMSELLGESNSVKQKVDSPKEKTKILDLLLDTISGIFTPILPAIVGAGMMKCILSLIEMFQWVPETSGVYQVFYMIADAAFYFLPFLIAVSAARKFKTNEFLSLCLAGVLLYPTLVSGANEGLAPVKFLLFDVPYVSYSSSVIPIILSVGLLRVLYTRLDAIIPDVFRIILTPLLTLAITVPIMLIVIAPLGSYVGVYLANAILWIFEVFGPLAGLISGALMPLFIIGGMHYAFFPSTIQSFATVGYDLFLFPINMVNNFAQAGATIAVAFKNKNKEVRSLCISTGISCIFGITEPAIYGINLKYKKPFYAAMIGSAIGGAFVVSLGVKSFSFAAPSILSLPTYSSPNTPLSNLWFMIGAMAISFIIAFVATYIFSFETMDINAPTTNHHLEIEKEILSSPLRGKIIPIQKVNDKTFADEVIGKGIAIIPTEGKVYAPFDGKIILVFRTKHAIAIRSNSGIECMIHIGLETVTLDGEGFTICKNVDEVVTKGELIATFDIQTFQEKQYDLTTPILVTNYLEYIDIYPVKEVGLINPGETILQIVKNKEVQL